MGRMKRLPKWWRRKRCSTSSCNLFDILNVLWERMIFVFLTTLHLYYPIALLFTLCIVPSFTFLCNKFWTFKTKTLLAEPKDKVMEFSKFFFVSLVGLIINVSAASLIVNLVKPQFGLNPILWANLANALAVVVSLIWNFLGYKLFVFTGQSKNLVV